MNFNFFPCLNVLLISCFLFKTGFVNSEGEFLHPNRKEKLDIPVESVISSSKKVLRDLKLVLMFYSDAFVSGSRINDFSLDAEDRVFVANNIISAIKSIEESTPYLVEIKNLTKFKERLATGVEITNQISSNEAKCTLVDGNDNGLNDDITTQNMLIKKLETESKIIIPSGWADHAVVLQLELNKKDQTIDLVVINTGDGVNFHNHQPDPDGVYPVLTQVWIKFKDIPINFLFDESAWFLKGLKYILKRSFVDKVKTTLNGSFSTYFYESFLANLDKYLVAPEKSINKMVPMQRSGSCTLSSIMASFMYHSSTPAIYHLHRLHIGHTLVRNLLKKYSENQEFLDILTDGFKASGRKFFFGLASSIAQQTLHYLEVNFPVEFKHAGLIGLERSKWLIERRDSAIKVLKQNESVLNNVQATLDISTQIITLLRDNGIRKESTQIFPLKKVGAMIKMKNFSDEKNSKKENFQNDVIKTPPRRPDTKKIKNIEKFIESFDNLFYMQSDRLFFEFLNVFRRAGEKWWDIIDDESVSQDDSLYFLQLLNKISRKILTNVTVPTSLEDIILLHHLQLAAWKCAVAYDKKQQNPLGLKNLSPPKPLNTKYLIEAHKPNWTTWSLFDLKNLDMFQRVLRELNKSPDISFDVSCFFNNQNQEENFFVPEISNFNAATAEVYKKMMSYEDVSNILDMFRAKDNDWNLLLQDFKLIIVMHYGRNDEKCPLENHFPHYYELMDTLSNVHLDPKNRPMKCDSKYWVVKYKHISPHNGGNRFTIMFNCKKDQNIEGKFYKFKSDDKNEFGNSVSLIQAKEVDHLPLGQIDKNISISSRDMLENRFYMIRHSLALKKTRTNTDFVNLLNYIKNASTGKFFDNGYFQYIINHFLNVPIIDNDVFIHTDKINCDSGFDENIAEEFYLGLFRLIKITLNNISENFKTAVWKQKKDVLILRAVNMSIILSRFVSKLDYDSVIIGNRAALWLANLYNLIVPFVLPSSGLDFSELDVSRLHLPLWHITSVKLKNVAKFMTNVDLPVKSNSVGYFKNRNTLEKMHWFLTKANYIITKYGTNVADDQFYYGIVQSPLRAVERKFFEELLKVLFLPKMDNYLRFDHFEYSSDGFVVKISNSKNISTSWIKIDLYPCTVVNDGCSMISPCSIFNSFTFMNFFNIEEDRLLASKGKAYAIADRIVYVLQNFKGSMYFIEYNDENYYIHRKWNSRWYTWSQSWESREHFEKALNYTWTHNMKIYKRFPSYADSNDTEILLFENYDTEPLIRVEANNLETKLFVHGMNCGNGWKLTDQLDKNSFEKHIRTFVENDFISAIDQSNRLVAIYPSYRLPEDPNRPLVLIEKETENENDNLPSEFIVLNVPKMTISSDQSLKLSTSLPGALVSIIDSKQFLLLPFVRNESASYISNTIYRVPKEEYIKIYKIPIIDGLLVPQSRAHKLLLAYYFALAFDFNQARELLLPAKSINHNESFSPEEFKIIKWIVGISSKAPEMVLLKLMSLIHTLINEKKFALKCLHTASDYSGIIKNITQITSEVSSLTFSYMLAIRELSEKFYVYRIFPEILKEPLFTKVFSTIDQSLGPGERINPNEFQVPNPYYLDIYRILRNNPKPYEPGMLVTDANVHFVIKQLLKENEIQKLNENLNWWKRIFHRRSDYLNPNGKEMLLYCMANNTSIREKFIYALRNKSHYGNKYFESAFSECKEYFKDFIGIDQSSEMTPTNLNYMKYVMESDLKTSHINTFNYEKGDNTNTNNSLISEYDRKIMNDSSKSILNFIKNQSSNTNQESNLAMHLDEIIITSNKTLSKLSASILKFTQDRGNDRIIEINFSKNQNLSNEMVELNEYIGIKIDNLLESMRQSASDLFCMTSSEIQFTDLKILSSLFDFMHQRKYKTFESLYVCYFNNSLACFQRKFPQLSLFQCVILKKNSELFFSRKILLDHFEFLRKNLESFLELIKSDSSVSVDDLIFFCDELDKINDFDQRIKSPVVMNFEFRSGKYRLRSEQVKDIELLTSKDSETNLFKSVVIQRMMAAGKTLVLGTISVITKALDSTKLSIIIPPSSLYQSNTTTIQNRTYQYFKKKGTSLGFPRFSITKSELNELWDYLKMTLDLIDDTMKNKNYLIMSPESLHSFLNSYIEALLAAQSECFPILEDVLKCFADIYRIFKYKSSIILDEIDMTMDPRKELNFPTQETESFNMIAVALIADIVEFMLFNKEINEHGLDILSNNQAALSSENYEECRRLIFVYIKSQLMTKTSLWCRLMKHPEYVGDIIHFLETSSMSDESCVKWIRKLHDSGDYLIANSLIIVKIQIHNYLEDYLKGTVNQNYGSAGNLRPEIHYAVPYVAANTPSASSVFADRWETLIKSLFMISASSCSEEITKEIIQYTIQEIINQSSQEIQIPIQSTTAYLTFKMILPNVDPMQLNWKNASQIKMVQAALARKSPAAIRILFNFYINQIFDKMTFPILQITSNALNMASMFGSVQGYSGTIDNVNILPQEVVKESYEDHLNNEKNNGGIALKLIKDSGNSIVSKIDKRFFSESVDVMLSDLLNKFKSIKVSAIIDTGAFFKSFKNYQIAEAILKYYKLTNSIETVLYYDEDSNQLEFLQRSGEGFTRGFLDSSDPKDIQDVTHTTIDNRFTFYDQRHITGSDILQPKSGHAIMTVGPRVLLRDILQGTLRMRQFMSSQKVHMVTTEATIQFYESKTVKIIKKLDNYNFKVSDVLALGAMNEDEKQRQENVKLAFVKIDSEIRSFILDEISRILVSEEDFKVKLNRTKSIFESSKELFTRSVSENPLDWLQDLKYENSALVLDNFAISRINLIEKHFSTKQIPGTTSIDPSHQRFNSLKRKIKTMIDPENKEKYDSLLKFLSETMQTRIGTEVGTESEVQIQSEVSTQILAELNLDLMIDEFPNVLSFNDTSGNVFDDTFKDKTTALITSKPSLISVENIFESLKLADVKYRFLVKEVLITDGKCLGVTRDLVEIVEVDRSKKTKTFPIFSKFTLEGSHLLIQVLSETENENGIRVILLSSAQASEAYERISTRTDSNPTSYWLCDLSGMVIISDDSETHKGENVIDVIPAARDLIFDALLFNGSLQQILANPVLNKIYTERWLGAENFKERAIFLLLRMKVLLNKDKMMFEDDDPDYEVLKQHAEGRRKRDTSTSFEGYIKEKLSVEDFNNENDISALEHDHDISDLLTFNIIKEIRSLFHLPETQNQKDNFVGKESEEQELGQELVSNDQDEDERIIKSEERKERKTKWFNL